ncbi:unnamed protein product [Choristocarpus tenellus]
MAEADVQFVAIDFPGHGKSAHMGKDAWYGMLDYPEYVLEAASALGWNKFTLVGHSMGAAVASLVASSFPELVERCVFIDTLGPITVSPAMAPKHLRRSIQSRGVLLEKSAKTYPSFEAAVEQRLRTVALWGGVLHFRESLQIFSCSKGHRSSSSCFIASIHALTLLTHMIIHIVYHSSCPVCKVG